MKWKKRIISLLLVITYSATFSQVSHKVWDELLKKHVTEKGNVNYAALVKEKKSINTYLKYLGEQIPDSKWSKNAGKAYWINVYNAVTVKLIVDNYPVKSIKDLQSIFSIPGVSTIWHKTYFYYGKEKISLDGIEHSILRKKYNDPRVHFAINCASKSCPKLLNEAYTADNVERHMQAQANYFINHTFYNQITKDSLKLSQLFNWFEDDFTQGRTLIQFLNEYSNIMISEDAEIDYLDYNWSLND